MVNLKVESNDCGEDDKLSQQQQIQRRRRFSERLRVRRQIYREMTSYNVFPLQDMAMKDFDEKLEEYLSAGIDGVDDQRQSEHLLDSEASNENVVTSTSLLMDKFSRKDESECDQAIAAGLVSIVADDETTSLECLREQYRMQFLKEKSIPPASVPSKTPAPAARLENGLSHASPIVDGDAKSSEYTSNSIKSSTAKNNRETKTGLIEIVHGSGTTCELEKPPSKQEQCTGNNSSTDCNRESNKRSHPQFLPILWSMEPRVFAVESASKGKRKYISSHLGRFMDHYWRECDVHNRHYYELIRENTPCRLYFDLEFNKPSNPELTDDITKGMLSELIDEISHQFEILYEISISRRHVVDLDSSTPEKFSRHWIIHLPNGELFSDARAAGEFVKLLVARLEEEKESGVLLSRGRELLGKHLLVNTDESSDASKLTRFIDIGVYTRNRLFRLMGSTKFGKRPEAALRIANANQFPFPDGFGNAKFFLPDLKHSYVESKCHDSITDSHVDDQDFEQFRRALNWEDHAVALEKTLVVPAHATKINFPLLSDPSSFLNDGRQQELHFLSRIGPLPGRLTTIQTDRPVCSYGKSPFPVLENFIVDVLGQRKGLQGRIGTFSLGIQKPFPRTISFNMKGNRFCERIGRAHKSNNIIWNVHLIDRVCWQSCHDPECRGFRGERVPLPEEVNIEIDEYYLDNELAMLRVEDDPESCRTSIQAEFDDPTLEEAMRTLDLLSL